MPSQRKIPRLMRDVLRWTREELELFSRRKQAAPTGVDEALTALGYRWLLTLGADVPARRLVVVWNGRLQTTAGTACIRTSRIDLNPRLRDIGISQVHRTLKHEAAHLLAHWRAGRRRIRTHGEEWRQACADLGIPDETACHNLPFPRRQVQRRFSYQCPWCSQVVKRVRKFSRFTACYRCCRKYSGGLYDRRFQFMSLESDGTSARARGRFGS